MWHVLAWDVPPLHEHKLDTLHYCTKVMHFPSACHYKYCAYTQEWKTLIHSLLILEDYLFDWPLCDYSYSGLLLWV